MSIGVEREADLTVPERFHDRTRVHALSEQQRCRSVPQVVEANVRKLRGLQQALRFLGLLPSRDLVWIAREAIEEVMRRHQPVVKRRVHAPLRTTSRQSQRRPQRLGGQ